MLQKVKFAPGFNKQVTSTGGESQWVNGDNVRFRYGTPEKIGGWEQLGENKLTGASIFTGNVNYATVSPVITLNWNAERRRYRHSK